MNFIGIGACMPGVNRCIVLHAWVGAVPSGVSDLVHEVAGFVGFMLFAAGAVCGAPLFILLYGLHKFVANTYRVIRVLAPNGLVGFAVKVGRVTAVLD